MASTLKTKTKTKLKDVKALGQQLLSSRAHINNLPRLLTFISPSLPPQFILESLLSLQAFFTTVLQGRRPSSSASKRQLSGDSAKDDSELIYRTWLRSKFDEFVRLLIEVLVSLEPEEPLKEVVLDTFMEFVNMGNGGRFNSSIYQKLLRSIINSETPAEFLSDLLASKYFKYIDVRYFTYISMQKLAKTLESKDICDTNTICGDGNDECHSRESMDLCVYKMHYIMLHIPPLEGLDENAELEMWSGSVKGGNDDMEAAELPKAVGKQCKIAKYVNSVPSAATIAKKMKLKFTKAWIAFLRLPLPVGIYKKVLVTLHQAVIPYLSNPIVLCDFLTRSYDIGGVGSVMALSSLFVLMTQHGLEYPNFYEKLYALLVPSIFMAKHRAKFFQLLDSCLKSPLLPAYLAAAFAKKLSRMALSVPPSGSLVIIALIHNLLRRHPSINCMVQKEGMFSFSYSVPIMKHFGTLVLDDGDGSAKDDSQADKTVHKVEECETGTDNKKPGVDHFNNEEKNPIKSNAMRSSLWEIDTLHHHYCPPVSRFVWSVENDLTVRSKTTEMNIKDFSSGSYATVFGDEIRRRVKQVPLAFYKATPTCLFSESEFVGWTFQCEENLEKYTGNGKQTVANASEWNDVSPKRQRIECP